jgi:hypothetical protein
MRYTPEGDLNEEDTKDALVHRFGSLNGLATGSTTLVVGGYRLGYGLGSDPAHALPARYSSEGSLASGWPAARVSCSDMSDRTRVLAGTVAAGVRSGARSLLQGTSAAAPLVARQLATLFVKKSDKQIEQAAPENYRPLLAPYGGKPVPKPRLGTVRVPAQGQPGIDPQAGS